MEEIPTFGPVRKTRYPELNYQMQGKGNWRILDARDKRSVGPQYGSQVELLADLDRFSEYFGCGDMTSQKIA